MQATSPRITIIDAIISPAKELALRAVNQLNDLVDAYFATLDVDSHIQYAKDMNVVLAQISSCGYNVELTEEEGFVLIAA